MLPHTPSLGQPSGLPDAPRHVSFAQKIEEHASAGKISRNDPRFLVDPQKVAALSLHGPLAIEMDVQMLANNRPSPHLSTVRMAAMVDRVPATPENPYGRNGTLAQNMERVGMDLYKTGRKEMNEDTQRLAITALTYAAAAHNIGAREQATKGWDPKEGSVIKAAAAQNRNPSQVARDLAAHGAIGRDDPRIGLFETEKEKDLAPTRSSPFAQNFAPALVSPSLRTDELAFSENRAMERYVPGDKRSLLQTQALLRDAFTAETSRQARLNAIQRPDAQGKDIPLRRKNLEDVR